MLTTMLAVYTSVDVQGTPPTHLIKPQLDLIKPDPLQRRAPRLPCRHRHGARERAGRYDLACGQRWVHWIARQQANKMAQRRERSIEHIGGMAAVDDLAVAQEVDRKVRQRVLPLRAMC